MPRAKRGFKARRRRKRILKQTEGFVLGRNNKFKAARETLQRSWVYEFRDRKVRKRDFRQLWIARLSSAANLNGTSYSQLMFALKNASIGLNRKMLSEIAIEDPLAFTAIVKKAMPQSAVAR